VDRDRGVIFGVKVVGRRSPNTHNVRGAENGTEYTMEALRAAARLYEGVPCNVDHPPRTDPGQVRSARDRFAWIENVRVTEAGLYGDLHFLDPTDPLAVKMLNAAESKPDAYALSHNALGKGKVEGGVYVVHEIPEVRSVDIVTEGGTNQSLFEGDSTMYDDAQALATAAPGKRQRLLKRLSAASASGDYELAKRLLGELQAMNDEDETAGGRDSQDEPSGGRKTDTESESGRGRPFKPYGQYNDAKSSRGKESMESRQRRARTLCKLAGLAATRELVEALAPLSATQAAGAIELIRRGVRRRPADAPRGKVPSAASMARRWLGR
jgi:hypothetical protein